MVLGSAGYVFFLRGDKDTRPVSFRTAKTDRGLVESTVTATGAVNAVVTVQVGSQVSGTILKLLADFNSKVKEGDVVAQIDPTRFRANVQQAEAAFKAAQAAAARARVTLAAARLDRDRAEELMTKGALGKADVDAARAKYDQAVAELASSDAQVAQAKASVGVARVDLERTTIKAPISGVVLQRAVDVGQTVAASLQAPTLFTIAQDLSQMEVRAAVDEADVGKLKEGQEARFSVDAFPGQEFKAKIHQIRSQPNVSQNVVTYDAILRLENPDGKLRPGMTATVRVVAETRENVLRVPNAALRFKPAAELIAGSPGAGSPGAGSPGAGSAGGPPGAGRGGGANGAGSPGRGARAGGAGPNMNGGGGAGRGGGGERRAVRVYKVSGNKVTALSFVPGVADDEHTEVLSGDFKEGEELVIDASGGPQKAGAAAQGPGATRGRGPRFF